MTDNTSVVLEKACAGILDHHQPAGETQRIQRDVIAGIGTRAIATRPTTRRARHSVLTVCRAKHASAPRRSLRTLGRSVAFDFAKADVDFADLLAGVFAECRTKPAIARVTAVCLAGGHVASLQTDMAVAGRKRKSRASPK